MMTNGIYPFKMGGGQNHVYYLSKTLVEMGIEVHVVCEEPHPFQNRDVSGVIVHSMNFRKRKYIPLVFDQFINYFKSGFRFVAGLERKYGGFDIVHFHRSAGLPLPIFFRKNQQKLVLTFHGTLYDELLSFLKNIKFCSPRTILNCILSDPLSIYLQKMVLDRCDAAIAVSNHVKKTVEQKYKTEKKVHVIPNGVDTRKFHPKSHNEDAPEIFSKMSHPRILYVGQLIAYKNIPLLLRSFSFLLKDFPKASLIVCGDGFNRKKIHLMAKKLKIEDQVIFTGYVSDTELPRFYRNCDIFTLPSVYEGQGIVLLEAMASGLPIVAMDAGGVPEIIDSRFGILVKKNDPYEFYNAIKKILEMSSRLKLQKGNLARTIAKTKYSWKEIAKKTIALYDHL